MPPAGRRSRRISPGPSPGTIDAVGDLLRREAAARRSSRWWSRGLWIIGVVGSALLPSVAGWSIAEAALGSDLHATV
jgi:hypothetical protein